MLIVKPKLKKDQISRDNLLCHFSVNVSVLRDLGGADYDGSQRQEAEEEAFEPCAPPWPSETVLTIFSNSIWDQIQPSELA